MKELFQSAAIYPQALALSAAMLYVSIAGYGANRMHQNFSQTPDRQSLEHVIAGIEGTYYTQRAQENGVFYQCLKEAIEILERNGKIGPTSYTDNCRQRRWQEINDPERRSLYGKNQFVPN